MTTNILTANIITGKTGVFLLNTSPLQIILNPLDSDQIYKINCIYLSNNSQTQLIKASTDFFRNNVSHRIASNIEIPVDSTIIVMAKETSVYLEPGDSMRAWINAFVPASGLISYEILE